MFAVARSFGSVLDEVWRRELETRLRREIEPLRSDFASFQKGKRRADEHARGPTDEPLLLSEEFSREHEHYVPPKFISEIHLEQQHSLFDYYFNMDLTSWQRFSVEKELSNAVVAFHHLPNSLKRVHNLFVPTLESAKYSYLYECLIVNSESSLLIGPASSGKSELVRHVLLDQVFAYSDKYQADHLAFTRASNSQQAKELLERRLICEINNLVADNEKDRMFMMPQGGHPLLIFIDDLSLPMKDESGA